MLNPFVPNSPFFYPLKTPEDRKVFWCFQGIEKWCIGNKWVKDYFDHDFWFGKKKCYGKMRDLDLKKTDPYEKGRQPYSQCHTKRYFEVFSLDSPIYFFFSIWVYFHAHFSQDSRGKWMGIFNSSLSLPPAS